MRAGAGRKVGMGRVKKSKINIIRGGYDFFVYLMNFDFSSTSTSSWLSASRHVENLRTVSLTRVMEIFVFQRNEKIGKTAGKEENFSLFPFLI